MGRWSQNAAMMHTRQMVVAFLEQPSGILMLHRSPEASLFPGMWAGVGGHIEPYEMNDPRAAIEREIREETGFAAHDLVGLHWQAIVLRLAGQEIRQQYVYFGGTRRGDFADSPEGSLAWVAHSHLPGLPMSEATRAILVRHLAGTWGDGVSVGVMAAAVRRPTVTWTRLGDWEQGWERPPI